MATFPVPNATDMQDLESIFGWVNGTATGGIFFPVILLVVWAVTFIGSIAEGRQVSRGWIWANFSCAILGIILGLLGFLQPSYIYFFIILLAFGLIWFKLSNSKL